VQASIIDINISKMDFPQLNHNKQISVQAEDKAITSMDLPFLVQCRLDTDWQTQLLSKHHGG